ncbi:DAK2 domain-containing protein [Williamsia sp. CHRR-6]|uniref:DAK2 domain-containing protein n=1 Tax=Williamsia sp. CHRR-6 TaxID=2835871 RepID=UPI001BD9C795|nr:DAK2 domain-containing protein [Williamsia sp. CHRR-6]MBT0565422.1 DAK2 domain-containing protein [Williamsia sp. CHRR-6]
MNPIGPNAVPGVDSAPTATDGPVAPRSAALDPGLVRDWLAESVRGLTEVRGEINDLNVFPIPDSDTGSNMLHTMSAAAAAVAAVPVQADVPTVVRAAADGAVSGARGNSGIILSQVLVGLADAADVNAVDGAVTFNRLWTSGLGLAALAATRALSDPREGTVLTLLRTAAAAAGELGEATPADLARAVADAVAEGLDRTTEQLPELARAGVVDAGGRGLLVVVDAMVKVLTGVSARRRRYRGVLAGGGDPVGHAVGESGCDPASEMDFEVMFTLDGAEATGIPTLRERLDDLGDAVVIVGDSSAPDTERFSVHVHTCEPGAAVEAGIEVGRVSDIRITCFVLDSVRATTDPDDRPASRARSVIAVVTGDDAAELFADAGASVVRADEGLDAATLAREILAVDAAHVVVMANGALPSPDLVTVAADARSRHRAVVFLPTLSMVQCLSALAVHDIAAAPDADAYAMAEAAAATRRGSVVIATEPMLTLAGMCEVGDHLGLIGVDILVIGADQIAAATALVDLMLSTGGELVTVLAGADIADGVIDALGEHVALAHPGVEFVAYPAGQPGEVLQVGVE